MVGPGGVAKQNRDSNSERVAKERGPIEDPADRIGPGAIGV